MGSKPAGGASIVVAPGRFSACSLGCSLWGFWAMPARGAARRRTAVRAVERFFMTRIPFRGMSSDGASEAFDHIVDTGHVTFQKFDVYLRVGEGTCFCKKQKGRQLVRCRPFRSLFDVRVAEHCRPNSRRASRTIR